MWNMWIKVTITFALFWLCISHVFAAENIALNKPANQTGVYLDRTADRAVDGRYYDANLPDVYCAHPDATVNVNGGLQYPPAQWWVDLEDLYRVANVTVYNTGDVGGYTRMQFFQISVGPTLADLVPCGPEYTNIVGAGMSVTIDCDVVGRFVHFQRTMGTSVNLVTLCEVEVAGEIERVGCPEGTWGINCSSTCGYCNLTSDCKPQDGHCTGECQMRWTGDRCNQKIYDMTTTEAYPINATMDHTEVVVFSSPVIIAVAVIGVLVVIIIVLSVMVWLLHKRRKKPSSNPIQPPNPPPGPQMSRTNYPPQDVNNRPQMMMNTPQDVNIRPPSTTYPTYNVNNTPLYSPRFY